VSKRKTPFLQDLGWRLEAIAYSGLTVVARAAGVEATSAFGGWLARTLGPLTSYQKVADRNIRIAFPDMEPQARRRLLAAQWDNTGRYFAEMTQMDRLTPESGRVEVVNGERLEAIARSGRPVIFISGHFANGEVMPSVILKYGIPCQVTYRAPNNPYFDTQLRESRARYGVKLFAPKGGDGARELLEGLKRGESAALMNDQKFNQGVAAPFFGKPAMTAPAPTRMALRFGAVLQPMSVRRLKGARFQVVVHEPIELERTGDRTRDIERGVEQVNAFIEARVREKPDDWFWVHKRWPNDVYRDLDAADRAAEDSASDSR
jgi:KDO2-lipid IV(A) lauroyltransferase